VHEFLACADKPVVSYLFSEDIKGLLEIIFSVLDVISTNDLQIPMILILLVIQEVYSFE